MLVLLKILLFSSLSFSSSEFSSKYKTYNGLKNHYLESKNTSTKALIILPGNTESAKKYLELANDLSDLDYKIFIWDHISHGNSSHVSSQNHPESVYVESYDQFINPLEDFISNIRVNYKSLDLIAHSMGANIALRLELKNNKLVDRYFLNTPMLHIKLKSIPEPIVKFILKYFFSPTSWGPFQGPYKKQNSQTSRVSSSQKRLNLIDKHYSEEPQAKRGGSTAGWVYQSILSTEILREYDWSKFKKPTFMTMAEHEVFVENKTTEKICNQMLNCEVQFFRESKHEIFIERDEIRNKVIISLKKFLNR